MTTFLILLSLVLLLIAVRSQSKRLEKCERLIQGLLCSKSAPTPRVPPAPKVEETPISPQKISSPPLTKAKTEEN